MQWRGLSKFFWIQGVFSLTLTNRVQGEETCPRPTAVMTTASVVSCCMKITLKVISWFCGWGIDVGISWVILLYHVVLIEISHSVTVRNGWADLQGPRQPTQYLPREQGELEGWRGGTYSWLPATWWRPWGSWLYGTAQDSTSQCLGKVDFHGFMNYNSKITQHLFLCTQLVQVDRSMSRIPWGTVTMPFALGGM